VIVKKLALDCNGTSILVLVLCGLSLVELQGLFLALVFLFFVRFRGWEKYFSTHLVNAVRKRANSSCFHIRGKKNINSTEMARE